MSVDISLAARADGTSHPRKARATESDMNLGVKAGDVAHAVIKASDLMVGKD